MIIFENDEVYKQAASEVFAETRGGLSQSVRGRKQIPFDPTALEFGIETAVQEVFPVVTDTD